MKTNTFILLPAPNASPFDSIKHRLTKEVGSFLDCDGKSFAWLVNPEEDHCHVLWWLDAPLNTATFTEVYISLGSGKGMVQGTGKFLSFEYPTIKYLQAFNNWKQGFFLSQREQKHEVLQTLFYFDTRWPVPSHQLKTKVLCIYWFPII